MKIVAGFNNLSFVSQETNLNFKVKNITFVIFRQKQFEIGMWKNLLLLENSQVVTWIFTDKKIDK